MSSVSDSAYPGAAGSDVSPARTAMFRTLGWISVAIAIAYVINNFLCFWLDWPGVVAFLSTVGLLPGGAKPVEGTALVLGGLQTLMFAGAVIAAVIGVRRTESRTLREDATTMSAIANYIVRAAFWAVLLIGAIDALISFLRVEDLLPAIVGDDFATELGRSRFRGPYIHFPLLLISMVIAAFTPRSLGFHWLALLVVVAELFIVLSRFVFSYEQAFQGDLVRFWYGALFLFASAYTLFEDGHVRVDVLYAGFQDKTKAKVNIFGSVVLGLLLCWTIMVFGMWSQSSIINSPLLAYEVSQSGFGMYVKYWMAGFLAIFAVTMSIQFTSLTIESIANHRGEPGAREAGQAPAH
jgi:TRAP-type mannitol/chloroaromatic compound transport system permease small subunit